MLPLRMPFGKHKGALIANVPTAYLRWCLREITDLEKPLHDAIVGELSARGPSRPTAGDDSQDCRSVVDVRSALKSWYREAALRFHPDRTLDNGAAMKAVNYSYERLQQLLGVSR